MKSEIQLIVGGARSGKSTYAERLADRHALVLYIATAKPEEAGMEERIRRHKAQRPEYWPTEERYRGFAGEEFLRRLDAYRPQAMLLDCLTLMISNLLWEEGDLTAEGAGAGLEGFDCDSFEAKVRREIDDLCAQAAERDIALYIVSNEVGLGLSSPYPLGNLFRDIAGRINCYVAQKADRVTFMVSGLPLVLKPERC